MTQPPPGSMGAPFVGEALEFLKDPFEFTLSRTRRSAAEERRADRSHEALGSYQRREDL